MADGSGAASDRYSLYVQLSRCLSLDGVTLVSKTRERDFVGNNVPENRVATEESTAGLDRKMTEKN